MKPNISKKYIFPRFETGLRIRNPDPLNFDLIKLMVFFFIKVNITTRPQEDPDPAVRKNRPSKNTLDPSLLL